jgi:hypothetical protein
MHIFGNEKKRRQDPIASKQGMKYDSEFTHECPSIEQYNKTRSNLQKGSS